MAELTYRDSKAAQANSYVCDSSQSSMVLDQLRVVEEPGEYTVDYEKCSVLHCAKCSAVLADSLGVCGEVKNINSIICLKVTQDVKVKAKFDACIHGALAYCTYKILECGVCSRCVGVVLHSTPPGLSSLRNLFLLRKEALNCYLLKTSTLVKASKVSFEIRPVRKDILELKEVLEAQLKQVNILKEEVSRSVQARASDSHSSTFAD